MSVGHDAEVEQAFELISQGNRLEDAKEFWEASDAFCQAEETLLKLSYQIVAENNNHDETSAEQTKDDGEPPPKTDDSDKIAALYKQQSVEYRERARKCLVRALENESAAAKQTSSSGAGDDNLSDEEAMSRIDLFAHLYAKPELIRPQVEAATVQEQQSSLEDRLTQLNQSLPQGFKTSDERMRDINKGLNRLGLSLYHDNGSNSHKLKTSMGIDSTKSETEQVDDIIAQARDEVALTGGGASEAVGVPDIGSRGGVSASDVVVVLVDEGDGKPDVGPTNEDDEGGDGGDHGDDDSSGDEENNNALTPDVAEELRDSVADAQASLAELMALLNDSINDGDSVVLLDQASAKQMLKQAGVVLVQATKHLVRKD